MAEKTATKTAKSPVNGAEVPLGAHPRNTGGKKGRSGRKPIAFVEECSRLADTEVLEKVAEKLSTATPDDPAWRWSAEYVTKYSKSPAPTKTEVEDVTRTPREERERELRELLARRNIKLA